MTKRIFTLLTVLSLAIVLTACKYEITINQKASDTQSIIASDSSETIWDKIKITKDEALSIAFSHADVTQDNVYDLDVELESDIGVLHYEIEFESERTEYKYNIDARTGEILNSEKDIDD